MSSCLLADFRESPALYYKEIKGEIERKEIPAFTLERAAPAAADGGRLLVCHGPESPQKIIFFKNFSQGV